MSWQWNGKGAWVGKGPCEAVCFFWFFFFFPFCLFWGSPWIKRGHGEMYTIIGRDGSGSSRSELSFFFYHVLMTFFYSPISRTYRTYIITFFFLERKKEILILEATPSEPRKQEEDRSRYLRRYSPAATAQPESHSSPLLTIIIAIQPLPTPTSHYIGDIMHSDNDSQRMIILTVPTRSSSSSTSNQKSSLLQTYHPIPQPKPHPFNFPTQHPSFSLPPTPLPHPYQENSTPQNIQSSPPRNRHSRRFQILLCNFNISKHRDFFERQNLRLHNEFVNEICEYYDGDVDV